MLSILLMILKIILFLLLGILGLLLVLILSFLLVPVRYRAGGSYYERLKGKAMITWFLHIISVSMRYEEELSVSVRIFGIPIGGGSAKSQKKALKKRRRKRRSGGESREPESNQEYPLAEDEDILQVQELGENSERHDSSSQDERRFENQEQRIEKDGENGRPREKIWKRIIRFFKTVLLKGSELKNHISAVSIWFKDEKNKEMIKLIFRQGKRAVGHILPRKSKGTITFGFDDPYTTGQVLAVAGMVYPICHRHLDLYPVFDRKVLEGEFQIKGRIRLGTLLICGIKVLLNKNFRVLLKRVMG